MGGKIDVSEAVWNLREGRDGIIFGRNNPGDFLEEAGGTGPLIPIKLTRQGQRQERRDLSSLL